MFRFILVIFAALVRLFRTRSSLLLGNLALRQQIAILKRRHPKVRLRLADRLFWIAARRFWSRWKRSAAGEVPKVSVPGTLDLSAPYVYGRNYCAPQV